MKETRPLLGWILAIVTLLTAAWLCWQCIGVWQDGNAPENLGADGVYLQDVYTLEDVAQRLAPLGLAIPAYAVLIVGALVAGRGKGQTLPVPAENRLRTMKRLLPEGTALPAAAVREEKRRAVIRITLAAALLLCAVPAGLFLLDGRNFASWELETVMAALVRHVLPWTAAAILLIWAAEALCSRSMARECAILKEMPKGELAPAQEKPFPLTPARLVIAGAAIVFIVLGVMNGGLRDVLVKAINICTECIGLG